METTFYGVNRDHHEKLIGIRELLERLALDCFNIPFSNDTGTTAKHIPPLDEIDEGETVSTRRALHFYSSASPYTEVSTIFDTTINSASSFAYTLVTSTIGSQHTSEKEEAREGGIYNRNNRGYFNGRLTNGKRFLNRTILFCNRHTSFNRKTYYCQQVGRKCFVTHPDSLVCHL